MTAKDPYTQSEYLELFSQMFREEYNKNVIITQLHNIKSGDGNNLFYVISKEGYRFLANIMGRKPDNSLLYWLENVDSAGKLYKIYYQHDLIVAIFQRGEKYNNEYLSFLYNFGNAYPAVRFIPEERIETYTKMMERAYKNYKFDLPEDLIVNT